MNEPAVIEYASANPEASAPVRLRTSWFEVQWHDGERRWVGRGAEEFERVNARTLTWPERVVIVTMVGCDMHADRYGTMRFELPDGSVINAVAYIPPLMPPATDRHVRVTDVETARVYGFILKDR